MHTCSFAVAVVTAVAAAAVGPPFAVADSFAAVVADSSVAVGLAAVVAAAAAVVAVAVAAAAGVGGGRGLRRVAEKYLHIISLYLLTTQSSLEKLSISTWLSCHYLTL